MPLKIDKIKLRGFRNYPEVEVALDPKLTVLVGPNAAGKTNVIEAMQLLTAAESFRRPSWDELIRWGQEEASLILEASGDGRRLTIELLVVRGEGRNYKVNGVKKRRLVDVRGIIPSIVFTPDDLSMVKGSAERRRAVLDSVGQQLSPAYGSLRREYDKVVRQRNALLKDGGEQAEIDAWSEQLIESGAKLAGHRIRLLARIAKEASGVHAAITKGQHLEATYSPSWGEKETIRPDSEVEAASIRTQMEISLREREVEEKARRVTLVGPHRDDVVFMLQEHDARAFASQGQQRSIALSMKVAEVQVMTELASTPPVLLLDDVMSELDEERRHELTRFVDGAAQTVVTTTNLHYFEPELLDRAAVIEVKQ